MNKQELIKKIKNLPFVLLSERYISQNYVLELLEQLDEPQSIKLKDVIARIKGFKVGTRKIWIDEILNELGSDYGVLKYKAGYEQGKLEGEWVGNQLKDADKIRQELNKPVVPQFVADWIEEVKPAYTLFAAMEYGNLKIDKWLDNNSNQETFALAWIFGYEVEEEKRYWVKAKGICEKNETLNCEKHSKEWLFSNSQENSLYRTKHTRKQLEEAGFGWVFDCEGIEIEEVE